MMRRSRSAAVLCAVMVLALFTHEACDKAENPLAPANTVLTITAVPSQIPINGSGARITVIGIRPDGNPIFPDTQITLTTNLGVLRPDGVACSSAAVVDIVEADAQGRAVAQLCGDGRIGDAQVTARLTNTGGGGGGGGGGGDGGGGGGGAPAPPTSGASATVTIRIGSPDNSRPTLVVSANPSVVPVGGESLISLLGRNPDNTSVNAGSRIRLTSNLGNVRCQAAFACPGEGTDPCPAVCTDAQGEAEATFIAGDRSGTGTVTAILGTSEPADTMITINAALDSLTLTLNVNEVDRSEAGEEVELTAFVNDVLGTPLQGILVRFTTEEGTLDPVNDPSNAQGVAESLLTVTRDQLGNIPQDGTFTVTATATSEGITRSDSQEITVRGAP